MENFANNYQTTLNGAITNSATTLIVTSATGIPSINFRILIDNEYLLVTGISGTTLTVTRGVEGSSAAAHSNSATITHIVTALSLVQAILDRLLSAKINNHYGDWTVDTDAATITMDFSLTDKHTVVLGGNRTIAFSNMTNGQIALIELVQDGTGTRTITWPTVSWSAATAPVLTTTANKRDLITIVKRSDGTYTGAVSISNY